MREGRFIISIRVLSAETFVDMSCGISYRIVDSRTERFVEHTHDYAELFIVLSGTVSHTANGDVERLKAGDVVFIRPSDVHKYGKCDGEFTFLNVTFTMDTLKRAFEYLGEGFPSDAMLEAKLPPSSAMVGSELRRLDGRLKVLGAIAPDDVPRRRTALRMLLIDLLSERFSGYTSRTDTMPTWLEELCLNMRSDGNFAFGAERMITLSGRTREHLSRSVKKYLGLTLSEFINDLRLNYIANMLTNSNLKIADIVFESGFNTMSLATCLFKEKYGVNMRDFRRGTYRGHDSSYEE